VRENGKVTANPFRHIDWNNAMSIGLGVVMPFLTMITWNFPVGMAWVHVHPHTFRDPVRDHAKVAFAGPGADLVLAFAALVLGAALFPVFSESTSQAVLLVWKFLFLMYFVSLVYAVYSLIPVPPLDGSRVLYYFGNYRLREFMRRIEPHGWLIYVGLLLVLGFTGLLNPFYRWGQDLFFELPSRVWG
jgi:Zn-dependent protease